MLKYYNMSVKRTENEVLLLRHEINSYNTKSAIAESLRDLVKTGKTKVTISDIIQNCGVSKNTFYYHFSDIIELIIWTLCNDFDAQMRGFTNGQQIREFVINYLYGSSQFLNFAYQHIGYDKCRECCASELYSIIYEHIEKLEGVHHWEHSSSYKKFVAEFYAEQISSIYLMQFHKPDHYHKEGARKCLEHIFDYSIPDMLTHESTVAAREDMVQNSQIAAQ
jgi:hypothetical protein